MAQIINSKTKHIKCFKFKLFVLFKRAVYFLLFDGCYLNLKIVSVLSVHSFLYSMYCIRYITYLRLKLRLLYILKVLWASILLNVLGGRLHLCTAWVVQPAINCIIYWDIFIFHQTFLSPQVKQCAIITYKHGIYKLPNYLRLTNLMN